MVEDGKGTGMLGGMKTADTRSAFAANSPLIPTPLAGLALAR